MLSLGLIKRIWGKTLNPSLSLRARGILLCAAALAADSFPHRGKVGMRVLPQTRFIRAVLFLAAGLFATPVSADEVVPQSRSQIELTFAPLVKQAAPAVVNVY